MAAASALTVSWVSNSASSSASDSLRLYVSAMRTASSFSPASAAVAATSGRGHESSRSALMRHGGAGGNRRARDNLPIHHLRLGPHVPEPPARADPSGPATPPARRSRAAPRRRATRPRPSGIIPSRTIRAERRIAQRAVPVARRRARGQVHHLHAEDALAHALALEHAVGEAAGRAAPPRSPRRRRRPTGPTPRPRPPAARPGAAAARPSGTASRSWRRPRATRRSTRSVRERPSGAFGTGLTPRAPA